jgi:hypothetical protein
VTQGHHASPGCSGQQTLRRALAGSGGCNHTDMPSVSGQAWHVSILAQGLQDALLHPAGQYKMGPAPHNSRHIARITKLRISGSSRFVSRALGNV